MTHAIQSTSALAAVLTHAASAYTAPLPTPATLSKQRHWREKSRKREAMLLFATNNNRRKNRRSEGGDRYGGDTTVKFSSSKKKKNQKSKIKTRLISAHAQGGDGLLLEVAHDAAEGDEGADAIVEGCNLHHLCPFVVFLFFCFACFPGCFANCVTAQPKFVAVLQ